MIIGVNPLLISFSPMHEAHALAGKSEDPEIVECYRSHNFEKNGACSEL
jgi:hypothetical protein